MKKHPNPKVAYPVAVALVILLGIGGYYFVKTKDANSALTAAPTSSTPGNSSRLTASASYLQIKELGIKLPLSAPIKDLIYTYNCTGGGGSSTTNCLHFSTTSIASIPSSGKNCDTSADPLGTYNVYTSRQSNEGVGDGEAGTLEASVNGYYIYYHHVQYACGDTEAEWRQVSSLIDPLLAAVRGAVSSQ